jgi:hypothetical protein
MTTSPTTASTPAPPLPPAPRKTFTIEAQRRLEECQERLEQLTQRACARRGQPVGTKARPVPAAMYGVIMATPGRRVQVVAHQAGQVLAEAAPTERRPRISRPG